MFFIPDDVDAVEGPNHLPLFTLTILVLADVCRTLNSSRGRICLAG